MIHQIQPSLRRSVRGLPRAACPLLAVALALTSAVLPARAATDASDVVVEAVDVSGGAPIGLARVILQGEAGTVGYTDAQGRARFESVATGSYRAQVAKRGYTPARSPLFEVAANRTTTIRVRLQRTGLKQIGSVSVSSSPARTSREVGQDDALRFLDGSLRDALGDLPGLTTSGDGVMIDGNDASQTGTSIDGVSIPGAGGAFGDRGINADLFGSATASSSATSGALGGSVGFRTLQPTLFAQQQATLQFGSNEASAALFVARGSVRNLGYVFEHAARGRTSPFTGLDFTDETGLTYRHDGDSFASGDLAKVRWSPSIAQTLTLTGMTTNVQTGQVCAQLTALFPCGFGPHAFGHTHGSLVTLSENATIGATSVTLGGFANASHSSLDEPRNALGGSPSPVNDELRSSARGLQFGVQLPSGDRHDLSLSAQTYGLTLNDRETNVDGRFALAQSTTFHAASLVDRIRPNQRLTLTARAGINGSNGGTAFTTALDVRWQPATAVAYDVAASTGDAGAGIALSGPAFPDPRSLTFDCAAGLAYGNVPSTNAARQRSSSLRASVERSGKRGRVALTAWSAHLTGAPVFSALDGSAIGLSPGYAQAAGAFASSPFVCGANAINALAFTSFQPADQTSRGATLAGTLEAGSALFAGYATVQSRFVTSATPSTLALTPAGAQVPGAPLHRAGIVATAKLGRVVDALANVSYTAANNPSRLPAYTLFNAGLAMPLREGSLAIVGTNLGNRFARPFEPALALSRAGGVPLVLPATPLAPRAVALTYTVRVGRLGASGSGAQRTDASEADNGGEGVRITIHANPMREGAHPDALRIDPDNDDCTPTAARLAQPAMDEIGRMAQEAEREKSGGRYPVALATKAFGTGIPLSYTTYDAGARYAIVAAGTLRQGVAFLNCSRLGIASSENVATFHLYVPPGQAANTFLIAYAPNVGLYFLPPGTAPGQIRANVTLEGEPPTPPADPFTERPAPACTTARKPLVDALVAAVRSARDAQRSGAQPETFDVADVVAKGTPPNGWFELKPHDDFGQVAALQCLHVAGISREHLAAAGIADARRPGSLGFTDRFGFYVIANPDQIRPPNP
jgi:hypothetical protein